MCANLAIGAHLPEELLSLLLEPPTLEAYPDESLSQFPSPIRGYLLTWHLIFDSYTTASLTVRNDYTEDLKSGTYIPPLLDFIFDVLGHSAAHALNLDKEGLGESHIRGYDPKIAGAESDERDMHWLMVRVVFLCVRFVPELFKAWFINCRSKQTRVAVEPWMGRYFSPLIVSDALDDVAKWAGDQGSTGDEGGELMVKVSKAAREVVAGYEVDESVAAVTVKVPGSYPIEGIVVSGTSRAVVNERKWQSWVRTTQGVITFSVSPLSLTLISLYPSVSPFPYCHSPRFVLSGFPNAHPVYLITHLTYHRTAASSTASWPSAATSSARSRARPSAPSATPLSRRTDACPTSGARRAGTSSTGSACTSGSRRAARTRARCAGTRSTTWGLIRRLGGGSGGRVGSSLVGGGC